MLSKYCPNCSSGGEVVEANAGIAGNSIPYHYCRECKLEVYPLHSKLNTSFESCEVYPPGAFQMPPPDMFLSSGGQPHVYGYPSFQQLNTNGASAEELQSKILGRFTDDKDEVLLAEEDPEPFEQW